jgi:hypothetical protein
MHRWQSGPMHGIANPENRGFKSLPMLHILGDVAEWLKAAVLKTAE